MSSPSLSAVLVRARGRLGVLPAAAVVVAAAAAATLGLVVPPAVRSYRGYLALGPGGLPYNLVGWLLQAAAQPFAVDPHDVGALEHPTRAVVARLGSEATRAYLDLDQDRQPDRHPDRHPDLDPDLADRVLPDRAGDRPSVPPYVAPQRQMSDRPPDVAATHAAMVTFLAALAAANPTLLMIRPSRLEGLGTPSLCSLPASGPGRGLEAAAGRQPPPHEFCHVHPETSAHCIFSLPDGAQAMRHGWAERHRLAGSPIATLPVSYLFVYAPRDADELRLWRRLVVAAARFAVADRLPIVVPDNETAK